MIRILRSLLLVSFFCILATGCTKSDRETASGKALIRGVNAIVGAPDISFKIEERNLGTVAFAASTQLNQYDDLDYTFNFDMTVVGESNPRRLASQFVDTIASNDYLFVLGGTVNAAELFLWQDEERQWDGTETVFELAIAHVSNELDAVDVYFADPSIAPAVGNELGTLSRGERIAPAEFTAGEYVLTLTAPGDTSTVYFTSGTRTWSASSRDTVLVLDKNPSRTSTVTVSRISGTGNSSQLSDARYPSEARILHAASETGNVDLAENNDFENLIASNLPFGEFTGDTPLTDGTNAYTFTDTGNQGGPLAESEFTIGGGTYVNIVLVGPSGELDILPNLSQRRPFVTSGRIGFLNVASIVDFVDIYLLEAGLSIDDNDPIIAFLPFKTPAPMGTVEAKSYEITVAVAGEKTALAGPIAVDIANADVIDIFILETADPNVADIRVVRYAP